MQEDWQDLLDYDDAFEVLASDQQKQMQLLEDNICPDCNQFLPDPINEYRGNGKYEMVTYCPCGSVYID